ncbi:chemotaxis protein CheW, partial [bacterium]|nr:chemotaxis protein CheW [bacterium]
PVERVDRLLIRLGDLIQAKMGLDETAAALLDETQRVSPTMLRQSLRGLDRHIRALQDGILGVRLVELGPLFQKLERTFREACRATGKDARLVTEGEHLELDKGIVDAIAEPLIHLVRNAVDHGLEAPEARARAGKDARGRVAIRARAEGSQTVLEVADDGGGIDRDRVLARGIERGLVPEGAEPSMAEVRELLFQSGFTTKEAATELSGRGIGLDAVRDAMARVGGTVEIVPAESGTTFRMRVPVTLAVMQALEIVDAGRSYFVPLSHVQRVLRPAVDEIDVVAADERVYLSGQEAIPLRELPSLLDSAVPERLDEVRAGVLLGMGDRRLLLPVERVGRRREIVVRSLGPLLPSVPGLSGCTELGDGRTVLILDPIALFEASGRSLAAVGS